MMRLHRSWHPRFQSNQDGMSLVEVLVAVVIISVGLLGIAALHITSLRNSFDANSRSKAVWFAYDAADRMRANPTSAKNGAYNVAMGSTPTGATMAASDLQAWKAALATWLPNGDGSITSANVGANVVYTITIQWQERDSTGADAAAVNGAVTQSFVMQTET